MYEIKYTENFKKQKSKLIKKYPQLASRINKTVEQLSEDPYYSGLKSHIIGEEPRIGNIWSSRVPGDIRILWIFSPEEKLVVILIKIGGHDFVY